MLRPLHGCLFFIQIDTLLQLLQQFFSKKNGHKNGIGYRRTSTVPFRCTLPLYPFPENR